MLAGIIRLENSTLDFYTYTMLLKMHFYAFCGDTSSIGLPAKSDQDINLTNGFFLVQGPADELYPKLQRLTHIFLNCNRDSLLLPGIRELTGSANEGSFREKCFRDTPPVAAVTIINNFENKVRRLESAILQQYLK